MEEKFILCSFYFLIFSTYFWWLMACISMGSAFLLSWFVLLLLLIVIVFNHYVLIARYELGVNKSAQDEFQWCQRWPKLTYFMWCLFFIFWEMKNCDIWLHWFSKIFKAWWKIFYVAYSILLIFYLIVYGSNFEANAFYGISFVVFMIVLFFFLFGTIEIIMMIWAFIILAFITVLLFWINICIVPWFLCFFVCCKKKPAPQNDPMQQENQLDLHLRHAADVYRINEAERANNQPSSGVQNEPNPEVFQGYNQHPPAEENKGTHVRFMERLPTMKVMNDMLSHWKKGYSFKSSNQNISCSVWLEEFKDKEQIIELHWGKGHIFHPDCIEDWAKRNKSCPLCRQNFVEIARKEQMDEIEFGPKKEDSSKNNNDQNMFFREINPVNNDVGHSVNESADGVLQNRPNIHDNENPIIVNYPAAPVDRISI